MGNISEEDKALFVQTVAQLPLLSPKRHPSIYSSTSRERPYLSSYYGEEVTAESVLSFKQPNTSQTLLRQLQQGHFSWQAYLDLHGKHREEAQDTLLDFLFHIQDQKLRTALIIHGKGGNKGQPPVLKSLLNHWLPQLPQVLAFHSALPKHGGTGALYVLLKKIY